MVYLDTKIDTKFTNYVKMSTLGKLYVTISIWIYKRTPMFSEKIIYTDVNIENIFKLA